MNKIEKVVESFFEIGEQIVVGVSGGADSITLINCLKNSKKNFNLIVAHLNHCLRGKESERDEEFVLNYCRKNDIYFVSKKVDVLKLSKEKKMSLEECGREVRYSFFKEFGCTIATAHTLSDVCETFFINILRGCSLKGLLSIPKKRGKIIRPLLDFTREDILNYCRENKLSFVEDSSNFEEKFLRNKLRLSVIPILKKINVGFEKNLLRTIKTIKQDEDFLEEVSKKEFLKAKLKNGLSVKYLNSLNKGIKTRILVKFLKENKISLTNEMVFRVFNLTLKGFGRQGLLKNKYVSIKRGILIVEEENFFKPIEILVPKTIDFSYKNLYFVRCSIKKYNYFLNKTNYLFLFKFDCDKIKGEIFLRTRKEKDRIKLLKRPTKTLKALMQEKGMSKEEKRTTLLLSDELGVFWVYGFGCSFRILPDENTKNLCLVFEKL